jgi:hypothetical protein
MLGPFGTEHQVWRNLHTVFTVTPLSYPTLFLGLTATGKKFQNPS